jgi:tRNA-modifying protein YgfZ
MSGLRGIDLSSGPEPLGAISFSGRDAAAFLKGQLSAAAETLEVGASTLAGWHNPQGRTVAILAVVRTGEAEWLAALPRELIANIVPRLRKYVMRSKLTVEDVSGTLRIVGVDAREGSSYFAAASWGTRRLLLVPSATEVGIGTSAESWLRDDVREGLPQVYQATSESFVAQMLNLDLLGAVAFDKGCYTGQEIIARAHYRGRMKRRMQRWRTTSVAPLHPGDSVRSEQGASLTVVRIAPAENGNRELLAVGVFGSGIDAGATVERADGSDSKSTVEGPLPLPYALPE